MQKLFRMMALAGLVMFSSCDEEDPKTTIEEKDPVAPVITAPVDGFTTTITAENMSDNLTITWDAADYNLTLAVSYQVQLDLASASFASPVTLGSASETSLSYSYADLNNALVTTLAQEPNTAVSVQVRVIASAAGQDDLTSDPIDMTITTFEEEVMPEYPKIWIAGDFQGWNISAATPLSSVSDNGIYEGYLYIPAGGTLEFKLYAQEAWEPTSWGTVNDGVIFEANYAGDNFKAPSEGYYLLSVDLNEMTYILINTSWGLIGGATPGGWDADTEMTFDATSKTWSVTADMKKDGSFKFRANKDWKLDFGIDSNGNLAYANHPWKDYVEQPQLTVPEDGNYTITLDLTNPDHYSYMIIKN